MRRGVNSYRISGGGLLLLLCLLALLPAPCPAQDDLFDMLDMESSESSEPEEASGADGLLQDLARNMSGSLTLRYERYGQRPNRETYLDAQLGLAEAWLQAETFAAWDSWRVDISGWLDMGNADGGYAGAREFLQDNDPRRRVFQLNDMYATWSGERTDVKAGLKVFRNGLSTLWSPADMYTPLDFSDPVNPRRLGRWLVEVDYALDGLTLTGVVFPVPQEDKVPGSRSRWLGSGEDFSFPALPGGVGGGMEGAETPDTCAENFSYLARAKAFLQGLDLFASAYYGLNPYYVLKRSGQVLVGPIPLTTYTKRTVKVLQFAGGFSTTHGAWEFHGEGNYNLSPDRREDSYLSYVGGFTRTWNGFASDAFWDTVLLTAEYAGEWIQRAHVVRDGYRFSSQDSRLGRNDLVARLEMQARRDWEFLLSGHFEMSEGGHFQRAQASYEFTPDLKATLGVDVFGGCSSSYHGRWDGNDRAYVELIYSF